MRSIILASLLLATTANADVDGLIEKVGITAVNEVTATKLRDSGVCTALTAKVEEKFSLKADTGLAKIVRKHLDFQGANKFAILSYNSKRSGLYRRVRVVFIPLVCAVVENDAETEDVQTPAEATGADAA